jgi:UDPglucose 6-dehydrogenase
MRDAPAIYIIMELVKRGAKIMAYDPKAIDESKKHYLKGIQNVTYSDSKYDVLKRSDALVLLTEWKKFRSPNFEEIKTQLKTPITFDGRSQYIAYDLEQKGLECYRIGK